jgi:alpha-tubulin suppressor-like RCC1 family protein
VDIAAGGQHLVALSDAGDVYTWGLSHYGQCGLGSTEDQPVPVHVASIKQKIFKCAPIKHFNTATLLKFVCLQGCCRRKYDHRSLWFA